MLRKFKAVLTILLYIKTFYGYVERPTARKGVGSTDGQSAGNPKEHPKVPHEHKWDWSDPNKPKRSAADD